ncbi:MAG: hypothetical protein LBB08_02540 [Rickettsiales bacterium]|nr:hypothetical protein [Rickettsiales bacterium]
MKKLLAAVLACFIVFAGARADDVAGSDFAPDYDAWAVQVRGDLEAFGAGVDRAAPAGGFVPLEAKAGKFFMSALSDVSRAIYSLLLPFLNIFVVSLFALWLLMESWQMMKDGGGGAWDLVERIVKKIALIGIWIWVMNHDPMELFMLIASPVVAAGTAVSNTIMDGASEIAGADVPDTCAAIREYVGADASMLIPPGMAADLLCVPTRVAVYFYGFVSTGFKLMIAGIGGSGLTFLFGLVFVILFIYNIWKFMLAALGVIVDLFFVLMFLPFTAVAECFKNKSDTKYGGVFRPVFDGFAGFAGGNSLSSQFLKFINAAIYFVVLSLVSSICVIILADADPGSSNDAMGVLVMGCLVAYLIGKTDELAASVSGGIDAGLGNEIGRNLVGAGSSAAKWGAKQVKTIAGFFK